MATATPCPPATGNLSPLALWHLLSLDAPTVAALWTWFIASANGVHLPIFSSLAMFLAVWMLYAGDRLMDARLLGVKSRQQDTLEHRHLFHHRHRSGFLTGIVVASAALAFLLPRINAKSIPLYLILGGFVFAYLILIHATWSAHRLPKEIAVGIFFAAATFIPTVASLPGQHLALLPSAVLFSTVCSLNCLFIYEWEHPTVQTKYLTHALTRLTLRHLPLIAIAITLTGTALALLDSSTPWPVPAATAIAAMILLLLHGRRHHIQLTNLRAAADLALTTPLLLVFFLK